MAIPVRDDRGGITVSVAVMPMVFTLFFLVIQVSLWYHGRSVATAAAHHALEAARGYQSNAEAGRAAGNEFLDQVGGLDDARVERIERGPEEVVVVVEADPLTVVPGFQPHITVELTGPVERVVP